MDYFSKGSDILTEQAYYALAHAHHRLTHKEMLELVHVRDQAQAAGQAEQVESIVRRMVLANMLLVPLIVLRGKSVLQPLERLRHGYDGLLKAAATFKDVGTRFSSYAGLCIRRRLWLANRKEGTGTDLKTYRLDEWRHLELVETRLFVELKREPSVEELAQACGFSPKHVRLLRRLFQPPAPFEETDADQQAGSFFGRTRNLHELTPLEILLLDERIRLGRSVLDLAGSRAGGYFRRRWGLDHPEAEEESAVQIAASEDITDERVTQVMREERRGVLQPALNRRGVGPDFLAEDLFPWNVARRTFNRP